MENEISVSPKGTREGSPLKRTAILEAARALFVSEGYDRTSMDTVAVRAKVSKRTVYDYFGDKRTLLLAVIEGVGQSLLESIQLAIRTHLADEVGINDLGQLEEALIAFTGQIASSTIESSDYAAFIKLVTAEGDDLPELRHNAMANAPEEAIAERLTHFDRMGLLEAPNARRAADHFVALSFALVLSGNSGAFGLQDPGERDEAIAEGVRAFLRAYTPR